MGSEGPGSPNVLAYVASTSQAKGGKEADPPLPLAHALGSSMSAAAKDCGMPTFSFVSCSK